MHHYKLGLWHAHACTHTHTEMRKPRFGKLTNSSVTTMSQPTQESILIF